MKVFIGTDHNGFALKNALVEKLRAAGFESVDAGDEKLDPADDFPQFASRAVAQMQAAGPDARAILLCGSGQGMCIAANRFKGVRASLCWDVEEARAARNDDDSNVLCLPARVLNEAEALQIAEAWLATPFAAAPRFKRRIAELDNLG
ncbi:MAG TPA: RpiB/LacA/LacB family sugar-phosphate isomerase [Candidatus Saccharimonadales bacterium]